MWRWDGRKFCLSLLVLIIVMFAFKKAFGINDYESQSEVLNEQWALAKIKNNHVAAHAIEKKLELLSRLWR